MDPWKPDAPPAEAEADLVASQTAAAAAAVAPLDAAEPHDEPADIEDAAPGDEPDAAPAGNPGDRIPEPVAPARDAVMPEVAAPPRGPGPAAPRGRDPEDLVAVLASQPSPTRRLYDAVRARPALLAAPVAIGLVGGLLAGVIRSPQYTAEARLAIARIDVSTQSLPGFAAGVQDLAVTYSRLVTADEVTAEAAKLLNEPESAIAGHVSASPIPQSPLFRIEATGGSADGAIAIANAAGSALRSYVTRLNTENPDVERLYGAYLIAARDRVDAVRAVQRAREIVRRTPGPLAVRRLSDAQARADGAALKADSVRTLYQQSLAGSGSTNVIQVVNPARSARSDRSSAVQRYAVTGLLAGLAVGVLLVLLWPGADGQGYQPRHARRL